jgi:hypothetical protein
MVGQMVLTAGPDKEATAVWDKGPRRASLVRRERSCTVVAVVPVFLQEHLALVGQVEVEMG